MPPTDVSLNPEMEKQRALRASFPAVPTAFHPQIWERFVTRSRVLVELFLRARTELLEAVACFICISYIGFLIPCLLSDSEKILCLLISFVSSYYSSFVSLLLHASDLL